jgi:hypothetical protein
MPWPKYRSGINRQIGETQEKLLRRLLDSSNGQIMIDPTTNNADWCAAKRLTQRGLMERKRFGGVLGWTVIYEITDAGREKVRSLDRSVG